MTFSLKRLFRAPLASALKRTSIPSSLLGPPKGVHFDTFKVIKKGVGKHWAAKVYQIKASCLFTQNPSATCLSMNQVRSFHVPHTVERPQTWVARIPGCRVYGKSVTVISPDDYVLNDISLEWGKSLGNQSVFTKVFLPRLKKIHEPCLLVASTSSDNYYHWLFDVLPRLDLIQKSPLRKALTYPWLLQKSLTRFQAESLGLFNFHPTRLYLLQKGYHRFFSDLTVPSMPAATGNPGVEVVAFLRKALQRSSSRKKYPRRILVSRSDSNHRKIINEEELYKELKPLGFSKVSLTELSFQEQIDIFSHAEVIMGIHGAGLSNIVFSNPGTKLIEIFPSSYVNSCFRVVALHCKMKYFYLVSERLVRDKNSTLDSVLLSKDEIAKLVSSV